jgi:hypothetical protein
MNKNTHYILKNGKLEPVATQIHLPANEDYTSVVDYNRVVDSIHEEYNHVEVDYKPKNSILCNHYVYKKGKLVPLAEYQKEKSFKTGIFYKIDSAIAELSESTSSHKILPLLSYSDDDTQQMYGYCDSDMERLYNLV